MDDRTEFCLNIAKDRAISLGIKNCLVASTTGRTGLIATKIFYGSPVNLIVVTHNFGFKEGHEMSEENRSKIVAAGAKILTGTMVLRGIGAAIRERTGYSQEQIIADTLRIIGEGIKVCCEISAMAFDAGLIGGENIIAVAGTGQGADTVCIIKPASSNNFFKMRVIEILTKPK